MKFCKEICEFIGMAKFFDAQIESMFLTIETVFTSVTAHKKSALIRLYRYIDEYQW